MRFTIWGGVFVVALVTLLAAIFIIPVISDPSETFIPRKGHIVDVTKTKEWEAQGSRFHELSITSNSGLYVELTVRAPLATTLPQPLVILLGGQRTGRGAAQLMPETQGVVVAALSYPYQGDAKADGVRLLVNIPKIQQALIDTAPAVLLALDYLIKQPYVDSAQVELVGVSLGAFFVSIPGALDQRITRVWLIHGAGDPESIFELRLKRDIAFTPLRRLGAKLIAVLSSSYYLKAERWVGQISPRPVIVINARHDEAFPASSIAALHQSLNKPNEIIWMEGQHIRPDRKDIVQQIASLVLKRIADEYKQIP